MTKEDKELLLKDLCARLPYNVICQVEFKENGKYNSKVMLLSGIFTDEAYFTTKGGSIYSNEYKPYLFPLSNMTDDQCYKFYCSFVENEIDYNDFKKYYFDGCLWNKILTSINDCGDIIDWFNKNHFDYRGLIEKGLAIDATGLNIY